MLSARRNVIYTVIRIVALDFPCRWYIMIATAYVFVRRFWLVFHGRQEMPATKKGACVHKHPVCNSYDASWQNLATLSELTYSLYVPVNWYSKKYSIKYPIV